MAEVVLRFIQEQHLGMLAVENMSLYNRTASHTVLILLLFNSGCGSSRWGKRKR
jgi:hypothetical protein